MEICVIYEMCLHKEVRTCFMYSLVCWYGKLLIFSLADFGVTKHGMHQCFRSKRCNRDNSEIMFFLFHCENML